MRYSIVAAAFACIATASAKITYTIDKVASPDADQAEAYEQMEKAVKAAIVRYEKFTDADKALILHYVPSVPTADGSISGDIRYGGDHVYMNEFTTMHEISHTLGIGQSPGFEQNCAEDSWPIANALLQSWDGADAKVVCDGTGHITPYGMNYQNEWDDLHAERHVRLIDAMIQDGM